VTATVRNQRVLCGVAILLFAVFFWSRTLEWATLIVGEVRVIGNQGFVLTSKKFPADGSLWNATGDLTWLYAAALVIPNLLYIFGNRVINQLVPALANTVMGVVLTTLTLLFIVDPAGALGHTKQATGMSLHWTIAAGVIPALVSAVLILVVGLAQLHQRHRATPPG
jgi:hypothetical protein